MILLTILILIILTSISIYFGYRAYILAGLLADLEEYYNELVDQNTYMYNRIEEAHDNLKRIDSLGAFESDDEAGTTFELLKEVTKNLYDLYNGEKEESK